MKECSQVRIEGGKEFVLDPCPLKSSVQIMIFSAHFKMHSPVFGEEVAAFNENNRELLVIKFDFFCFTSFLFGC